MSIAPADYANWHDVRTELMSEAKTGFKARVEAELAAAQGECLDELKAAFQQEERAIEHEARPLPTSSPQLLPNLPLPNSRPRDPSPRRPSTPRFFSRSTTRFTRFPVRWPLNPTPATPRTRAPDVPTLHPHPFPYPASVDVSYNVRRLPLVKPPSHGPPAHNSRLTRAVSFARGSSSRTRRALTTKRQTLDP